MTFGYSGTPLAKKMGIKKGHKILVIHPPDEYFELFSDLPEDLEWSADNDDKKNIIHYFTNSRAELERDIQRLKMQIVANGAIWISWPKKASKIQTDLDGNSIRGIGLQSGLVDIKVCAVSDIWSGLKFVIPLKERG